MKPLLGEEQSLVTYILVTLSDTPCLLQLPLLLLLLPAHLLPRSYASSSFFSSSQPIPCRDPPQYSGWFGDRGRGRRRECADAVPRSSEFPVVGEKERQEKEKESLSVPFIFALVTATPNPYHSLPSSRHLKRASFIHQRLQEFDSLING